MNFKKIVWNAIASIIFFAGAEVSAEQLSPPNIQMMDRFSVNVASGQATTSLNTVSIGGAMGLTHNAASHTNNFMFDADAGTADIGMTDAFSSTAYYEQILPMASSSPYVYKGVSYYNFSVMRVSDGSGSVDFVINVNGSVAPAYYNLCTPTCPQNYSYEILNDGSRKGDIRNTLVVNGDYLDWTKPDGTVVQFYRGQPANGAQTGRLSSITYPNGYKITVTRRQLNDSPIVSVNTNTGFQLNYVYTDDSRQLDPSKAGINIYNNQVADSHAWAFYNPKYIYAINNAVEYCNPQPGLPEAFGGPRASLPACAQKWANAMFTWPGGMPRALYLGDSTVSIAQTINSEIPAAVTEYRTRAMDKAIVVVGGNPEAGKWFIPRLIGVKSLSSTTPDINYTYQNVGGYTCSSAGSGLTPTYCAPDWYAKEAGRMNSASGPKGIVTYSIDQPINGSGSPVFTNGGADITVSHVDVPGGGVNQVSNLEGSFSLEVTPRAVITASTPNDSVKKDYSYDDNFRGNLTKITYNNNSAEFLEATYPSTCSNRKTCNQATSIKDARGNVTNYTYNEDSGQLETITLPANKKGIRAQTRYEYTALSATYKTASGTVTGSPIYLKTAERYCVNSNYSGIGDGHSHFNGSCGTGDQEVVTRYEYNSNNLLLTGVTVTADATTRRTCYQYDIYGNRIGETQPLGTAGSCVAPSTQEAAPYTSGIRYNFAKQVTGTIAPDPDNSGPLHYRATRNTYHDTRGLLTKVENGELSSWQNELVKPSDWGSAFTVLSSTSFGYDAYGRKTSESTFDNTGTLRNLIEYSYDATSHVKCKTVRMTLIATGDACTSGNLTGNNPDRITQYTYDSRDQVLTEQRAVGTTVAQTYVTNTYDGRRLTSQTDANSNRTELRYDSVYKRLQFMVFPSLSTKNAVNEADYNQFSYDLNGNKNWERKRNGAQITYTNDNLNRPIYKDFADNTNQQDVSYDYDLRGLVLSSRFGSDTGVGITNTYDGFGNVNSTTTNMGGIVRTLRYGYDANNNRVNITHPDNNYFQYGFDGLNRLNQLFEGKYNGLTTPSTIVSRLTINYRPDGRRKNITRPYAATTTYNYDDGLHLTSFVQNFSNASYNLTNSFTFNNANQIATVTFGNNLYYYQGNENRSGTYVANNLNQYSSIAGQPLGYDLNANLTNDGSLIYKYDDENRLISTSGATTSAFVYDPLGRLFQSTVNGVTTQYLYDGDALVTDYNYGSITYRYAHGDQADEPLMLYSGSAISSPSYLHTDHQGSIIAWSNVSGAVTSTLSYDSFGIPKSTNTGRFGYTGQIWFKELGLFYYKARMYHPKLGRFLQTDPIGYKDQMNLYAYTGNDPINKKDPTGKCETGKNGVSAGVCPKDADAAKLVDAAMKNKNSKIAAIDKQAINDGKEIKVHTGKTDDDGNPVKGGVTLGSKSNTTEADVTIDLTVKVTVKGTDTSTGNATTRDLTPAEVLEHEVGGHGVDFLNGVQNINNSREPNAMDQENIYREKSGIPFQRTDYQGVVSPL